MAKRRTATKAVPIEERPILEVWVEYKKVGSETIRNFFMEKYLPLVKYNAERIHSKLPDEVDVDDLKQAGIFGLMDAIDSFDLGRGVKFETFCAPRIRGAILDELRSMDWVPRLVRSRTNKVEGARKSLQMQLGRKPTEKEIAERLEVDMGEYRKLAKDAGPTTVVSLNRKYYETDSNKDVTEIDVLKDRRQINPQMAVQKRDVKELVTKGLSRAERLIVILYYYEELTMKEIGVTLDLSESRVSQMHSSILARLKAQMQKRDAELRAGS
ncbi:MAG: FliA/WhiG family RNA polymerase sigma factor [Phycisphaerae bacterium]|nr:FliA/WhiG family RNA polymerase sigma factor [Phycisphaerae bacterium]